MAANEATHPTNLPSISTRAARMPRSSIRRLFNAAKELEATGVEIVRLDIGDPDFDMPERMASAVKQAIDEGKTHYSPMPGLPELRQAIAGHVAGRMGLNGLGWQKVVCSQGATQALNACFQLTCSMGDKAILPEIYFPNYMQQLCLAGIAPLFYSFDVTFQPIEDSFDRLRGSGARALLVNSPSNPTGAVFPRETIERIYNFAREEGMWIISDEAYFDFSFDGEAVSSLQIDWQYPIEERRVLAIFSFSKSYAATGLRMGWTVCPHEDIAMQLGLMNEPLTGSLTTPLQYGVMAALADDDTAVRRDTLRGRRDTATRIMRDNGFKVAPPAGGIFFFVDISATGMTGDEFADRLLAEEHVAVVPGSGFGLQPTDGDGNTAYRPSPLAERCVRICFARPESDLASGVEKLASFIANNS